ncbi:beta-N-acetylglucosaminidase [Corynebacterium sp.]|uniref:beta-N-acetylglucosaminidase n=1 Tax=Corynebacterium sp. TaxID=1720 RepID=UPI0026DB728F|nr:beta-N-acetylglucosaminidase [Corynebacterium sp.]MDO5032073.1 beta-N-acetylglucosaminidase [Corynebacterium sp.]
MAVTTLTACGKDEPAPEAPSAAPETTASTSASQTSTQPSTTVSSTSEETSESSTTSESESESEPGSASDSAQTSGSAGTDPSAAPELNASVEEAYAVFGGLVPGEIFAQFDRCDPNGVKDSFNCSGSEVGQFQFFKRKAKASQTTQVLTELRSSRVVEDSGDRVVGWSMLGNTAILTVVDNKDGLIMQQMITTDQDDPEERLKELGLVS